MGYGKRDGTIRTFWPDDTDKQFHLAAGTSLSTIMEKVKEKWGQDVDFENIDVTGEHIHTDCLGYDSYDPGDYTDFVVVTLVK